ncbi:hypothetical protein K8R66_01355 [bacterium]|nr:hypothetical protein [bacterium]
MFYFLAKNKTSMISEEIVSDSQDYEKIIEIKKFKINNLLTEVENIFDKDFQNFINSLDSYLALPIEIDADDLGNKYPFSNPIDKQISEDLEDN